MKEVLSENNVKFAYVEVTSGMGPLKQFLKLRDTFDVYEEIRKEHRVGIPSLFVDDRPYVVSGPDHARQLIEELHLVEEA